MHQKHRDVKQFLPTASVGIQDGFDIGKNAVDLGFKIKLDKVPIVIERQSGYAAIVAVASCDARPYTCLLYTSPSPRDRG